MFVDRDKVQVLNVSMDVNTWVRCYSSTFFVVVAGDGGDVACANHPLVSFFFVWFFKKIID